MVAGRMWNSAGGPTAPRRQQVLSLIAVFIAGELCGGGCFHRRCPAPGPIEGLRDEGEEGGGPEGVPDGRETGPANRLLGSGAPGRGSGAGSRPERRRRRDIRSRGAPQRQARWRRRGGGGACVVEVLLGWPRLSTLCSGGPAAAWANRCCGQLSTLLRPRPGGIIVGLAEQLSYRSIQLRPVSKVDLDGAMISASATDAAAPSAAGSSTAKSPAVVILVCVPWRRGPVDLIWAETFPEVICIPQSPLASGGTLGP